MADCSSCVFQDTSYLPATCAASFITFMAVVDNAIRSTCNISEACSRNGRDDWELNDAEYDFIIVGGGVAGPVVASRLAENESWKVLILEAGPEEATTSEIPGFSYSAEFSKVDWNYTTVPQKNACLQNGGVCTWPRGKAMSGTGCMQGMKYSRGHRSIYDRWESYGNPGWGYEDMLKYFIKSERNLNIDEMEAEYHGTSGPMAVMHFNYHPPIAESFVAAGVELGYRNGDLNGANQTGVTIAQAMVYEGLRASSPRMYLRPYADKKNLVVAILSHVTKIIIDEDTKKATGLEFLDKNGKLNKVYATKEVILSAGTIGSPQLLMVSGIGPREDLEALNIPVLSDRPVGQNLYNHISVPVAYTINETSLACLTEDSLKEFIANRSGPVSGTGLMQVAGFLLSKYATDGIPDLQTFFEAYRCQCSATGSNNECTDGTVNGKCRRRQINFTAVVILPRSVGYLKLNTSSALDHPIIDPQYLTDQHDIDVLLDGVRIMKEFAATEAMKPWDPQLNTTNIAGCEDEEFDTDEYWICVIKTATGPENHQGGTCRMGPANDTRTVVDPTLKVHGISNLRVIDASVFPYMPSGNPISTIIAAAEKGADLVKADWS